MGVTASTIIPTALVITNWFQENRGLALGVAFAGIPLGGTGVTIFANYVVLHYGFRAGYFAMGVPIALIVVPLLAAFVRTRPDAHADDSEMATASPTAVPGLELSEALRSRSFWLIAIAEVLFATASLGVQVHLVPYLTGIGYAPTVAAGLFAAMFIFSAIGSFVIGSMADSRGGRVMLTAVFVAAAAGIAALLGAPHFAAVAACIVVFGFVRETRLLPLVINESLGVRRLRSILGLLALFTTFGFAGGAGDSGADFRCDRQLQRRLDYVHRDGTRIGAGDALNSAAGRRESPHCARENRGRIATTICTRICYCIRGWPGVKLTTSPKS